ILNLSMTPPKKSEPGTPPMRELDSSFGVPLSAAAICIVGGSAEGRRGAALVDAAVAACAGGTPRAAGHRHCDPRQELAPSHLRMPMFSSHQAPPLSCAAIRGRRRLNSSGDIIRTATRRKAFA